MRHGRKILIAALLVLFGTTVLGQAPSPANAFTFASSYGAHSEAFAVSDPYGIYNHYLDPSSGQGDGLTSAGISATASDSAGGGATGSATANTAAHQIVASGSALCPGSSDCYDTYYGGYAGIGGTAYGDSYDTYTMTCSNGCTPNDLRLSWTITGSFGALDDGPVCQGTAVPLTLSAVACESLVQASIVFHPTPSTQQSVCASGSGATGCPPKIIDYQPTWTYCQGGAYPMFYCPSSTSFSLSGTVDITTALPYYVSMTNPAIIEVSMSVSSDVDLPGSESVSATLTYTLSSVTPGVTVTSAACACSQVTPAGATTTTASSSLSSVAVGSPTTIRAVASGTGGQVPTGSVTFSSSGSGTFSPTNSCTLSGTTCSVSYTPTSAAGSPVTITANYGGDPANIASSGTTSPITITGGSQATTSTSVNCAPSSITVASSSSSSCTATVSGSSPTGTVSFSSSSGTSSFSPSTSCTLSSGSCSVTYKDSGAGTPTITGTYGGDSGNLGSSGTFSIGVTKVSSSVAVSCAPASVTPGASSTCTASVTGSSPTGSVSWSSSSGTGVFTTSTSCTLSSGSCSVGYHDATSGTPVITGSYGSDSGNLASSGVYILANLATGATAAVSTSTSTSGTGTVSVDNHLTTGVTVSVSGAPLNTPVTILTASLPSQPPGTGTLSISALGFYDVKISGITTGTANICILNAGVTSSTVLQYYSGGSWVSATGVVDTVGVSICGNIPVSALNGTPIVLAIPLATPQFPFSFGLAAVFLVSIVIYALVRRTVGVHRPVVSTGRI